MIINIAGFRSWWRRVTVLRKRAPKAPLPPVAWHSVFA